MAGVSGFFYPAQVFDKNGDQVDLESHCDGKKVAVYFSTSLSNSCNSVTELLVDLYEKHKVDKNFEVIFISLDPDDKAFKKSYDGMPWLVLDLNAKEKREQLLKLFRVPDIPTIVTLEAEDGFVYTRDGTYYLINDHNGNGFPWEKTYD